MIHLENRVWSPEAGGNVAVSMPTPLGWGKHHTFSSGGRAEEFLRKIWGGKSRGITVQVLEPEAHGEVAGWIF